MNARLTFLLIPWLACCTTPSMEAVFQRTTGCTESVSVLRYEYQRDRDESYFFVLGVSPTELHEVCSTDSPPHHVAVAWLTPSSRVWIRKDCPHPEVIGWTHGRFHVRGESCGGVTFIHAWDD